MDIGIAFAVFIIAMAVTHLVVRIARRVSRRMPHKAVQAQSAAQGGAQDHVDWYCFFRPQQFSRRKNSVRSVRQSKKARPRPRAMVVL